MNRLRASGRLTAPTRVVSVLSGKGGVGKSVIAFNLADRISALGNKVLLVDADLTGGNLHILANADARYGLAEFALDNLSLAEAITELAPNLDLLPSLPHPDLESFAQLGGAARVTSGLRKAGRHYRYIIIDHPSGASTETEIIAHSADIVLLTLVPELTSISDAYGLYKRLTRRSTRPDCRLLVNRVADAGEAAYIRSKFRAMSERFLGHSPSWLGALPEDSAVRASLGKQQSVVQTDEFSSFACELTALSEKIAGQPLSSRSAAADNTDNNINNLVASADKGE